MKNFLMALLMLVSINISAKPIVYTDELIVTNIVRVYDADTLYVDLQEGPEIFTKNIGIRIRGIDTPELRTKCLPEKAYGYEAKAFLRYQISLAKKISFTNYSRGKYFRIVADMYLDDVNVAGILIKAGYAYPYFGGTKNPWCEQLNR